MSGTKNAESLVEALLWEIGEDPHREGLKDTPRRVVNMWKELFRGYIPSQKPVISVFKNGNDGISYDEMIVDQGSFYSHCEHHMVPFFGKYWFGYIPSKNGAIIGLSKVARIVDYHAAKLQIQERLVNDIVEDLWSACAAFEEPIGMGLVMQAEHLCKTMRGVKKEGKMTTIKLKGVFLHTAKQEFLSFCKTK